MKTFLRFVAICFFIWLFITLLPALLAVALPLIAGIGIIGILFYLVFVPRRRQVENQPPKPKKMDQSEFIDV
jgi:hypothetical protein